MNSGMTVRDANGLDREECFTSISFLAFDFEGTKKRPHFAVLRPKPLQVIVGTLARANASAGELTPLEALLRMSPTPLAVHETWVVVEFGIRKRSATAAAIAAVRTAFPKSRFIALGTWDILSGIGFAHRPGGTYPTAEQVHDAVMARAGAAFKPASFDDTWTAAVALAGAERVWGTTNQIKPGLAASRRRKAPEHVGEHRADRNPCRPVPAALSLAQVAAQLGVDRTTAYRLAERKEFASFTVGRQIRVHRADLEAYLSRTRRPSAEETAMSARGKLIVLPRVSTAADDEEKGHRLADELGLK